MMAMSQGNGSPHSLTKEHVFEPLFQQDLAKQIERAEEEEFMRQRHVPLLPATYRNRYHMVRLVSPDVHEFLNHEFDLQRLNTIHKWLWLVGLPSSPRPLHYQILKKRDIIVTEQLDLHLIWVPTRIYIKPLSRFMLSPTFWRSQICPHPHLYRAAVGFILSYVALIEREVDYHIAKAEHLIPKEITWTEWLAFVEEIICTLSQARGKSIDGGPSTSSLDPHTPVNPRFYYGELRLGRLNWIYRLVLLRPRGYMSGCTTYGAFMRENVNSLITLFAYTTIVLSAMQVGLGTTFLAEDYAFGMASYVFSIFSILAPLLAIAAIFGVVAMQFVVNLLRTLRIRRKRQGRGSGV